MTVEKRDHRVWILLAISLIAFTIAWLWPPVAQDINYHRFADVRALFGIPNGWNTLSNLPFILVAVYGLVRFQQVVDQRTAYLIFCFGVFSVGIGSAYYHVNPSTATLVWDRLPMTIAFMALFSMVLSDRVSYAFGKTMLWPLLLMGIGSVWYWAWTEQQLAGDLRAYALVQFLPMLLLPIILLLYKRGKILSGALWITFFFYVLAKIFEYFDAAIFTQLHIISGHSLKHFAAAVAVAFYIFAVSDTH